MVFEYQKNADGLYVCGICGETRVNQNTMHYHLHKHQGTMPHACGHCEKRFYQKSALEDHIKLRHSTLEATIKCPFEGCLTKFHKKEYCRLHIARNHLKGMIKPWILKAKDSNLYTCGVCKKDCKSHPAILYHVMDHAKDTTILKEKLSII